MHAESENSLSPRLVLRSGNSTLAIGTPDQSIRVSAKTNCTRKALQCP